MLKHYFKVAFRNLRKYRNQTLVSVVGMATGFACFAMSALWIRYEMTYDGFHANADRLYRVSFRDISSGNPDGTTTRSSARLGAYLKNTFPEINNATEILDPAKIVDRASEIEIDNMKIAVAHLIIDSAFMKFFNLKIVEGSKEFMVPNSNKIAITEAKARQWFGNESAVGKTVKEYDREHTVSAVVTGFAGHSNYSFDILSINTGNFATDVIVELVPDINLKAFEKKLSEHKTTLSYNITFYRDGQYEQRQNEERIERISLTSLTSIRYKDPMMKRNVKFQHIIIFAVAGALLILCTLFNYLTLFLSRFRIRMHEFALRIVFGASNASLFALLAVEFLTTLVISLLLGMFLIQMTVTPFRLLSEVNIEQSFIYFESMIYIAAIILFSLAVFWITLTIFRRRTLNVSVRRGNNKIFRKTSVVAQLIISIMFAFCTIIILKQIYHLHNTTDLGFEFKNRGRISLFNKDAKIVNDLLKQIPEVTESVACSSIEESTMLSHNTYEWEGKPENVNPIPVGLVSFSEALANFYEFKLVAGDMLTENDAETDGAEYVLINESAVKVFGWDNPIGKTLMYKVSTINGLWTFNYIVKGVIKNVYNNSPTIPVNPVMYRYKVDPSAFSVLFKYRDGTWKTCREKIDRLLREKYPDAYISTQTSMRILNLEEEYDKLLKSENTLITILTVISFVCIIICIFGFVSIVALTCEERRKEIAIRKINGATMKDILDIFFKEHITLLAVGALIAFPVGYIAMKHWLEGYILRTTMDVWVYIVILLILTVAIILCIGGRVYKTSRENPIEAIKN
jgi:heme/copper-type cytochrome/quinol oxidase subunit 2